MTIWYLLDGPMPPPCSLPLTHPMKSELKQKTWLFFCCFPMQTRTMSILALKRRKHRVIRRAARHPPFRLGWLLLSAASVPSQISGTFRRIIVWSERSSCVNVLLRHSTSTDPLRGPDGPPALKGHMLPAPKTFIVQHPRATFQSQLFKHHNFWGFSSFCLCCFAQCVHCLRTWSTWKPFFLSSCQRIFEHNTVA